LLFCRAQIEDKAMELDVTFTLIASRIDDLGQQTLGNDSSKFVSELPNFVPALSKVVANSSKLSQVIKVRDENTKKLESLQSQLTSMLHDTSLAKEKYQKAAAEEISLQEESRALVPILQKTAVEFQQIQTAGEAALNELRFPRPNTPMSIVGIPLPLRAETVPRPLGQVLLYIPPPPPSLSFFHVA